MNKATKYDDFSMQFRDAPTWVRGVRFVLMFVGVVLVNHVFWPMKFEASSGWIGYLRAALAGMFGSLLWFAFDLIRQKIAKKPQAL